MGAIKGQIDLAGLALLVLGDMQDPPAMRGVLLLVEQHGHVSILLDLPGLPQGGQSGRDSWDRATTVMPVLWDS